MNTTRTAAADMPSPHKVWLILLLMPVVAYAIIMIQALLQRPTLSFDRLDLLVLLLVLAYCCAGTLLAWRRSAYLARCVTCLYSILIASAACEMATRLLFPLPENVPWPPMRRITVAANTFPGMNGNIEFTVNDLGVRGRPVRLEDVDVRMSVCRRQYDGMWVFDGPAELALAAAGQALVPVGQVSLCGKRGQIRPDYAQS
jgi:hypothetical protein